LINAFSSFTNQLTDQRAGYIAATTNKDLIENKYWHLMVKNMKMVYQKCNGEMEKLSNKTKKIFTDIIKKAKMVDGICPHCDQHSLLIGIVNDFYRCMNCGGDIEQKVNGKISYLPIELKEYDEVKGDG